MSYFSCLFDEPTIDKALLHTWRRQVIFGEGFNKFELQDY